MIKKLITFTVLIATLALSTSIVYAQRGIDPNLKPQNAPGVPEVGSTCPQDKLKVTEKDGIKTATCSDPVAQKDCKSKVFDPTTGICLGEEAESINAFLQILGGALLMLSGGLAVIVIAVGGFMYMTSRGNQQQMEYAKNTLVYGVLGMLVVIFSYFIVSYVIALIVGTSG